MAANALTLNEMDNHQNSNRILMDVPVMSQRSISPISPTRSEGDSHKHHRGGGLLSVVSRRFGRKTSQESHIDYHPEDDSGCSTDSCSSAGANLSSNYSSIHEDSSSSNNFEVNQSNMELTSVSSCSTDEPLKSFKHSRLSVHFRSTSSLRKALRSLSISTRSLSCNGSGSRERARAMPMPEDDFECEKRVSFKTGPEVSSPKSVDSKKKSAAHNLISQRSKTPPPQRRILRQPVSYMYIKGLSGLPTQRVPRSSVCCPQGYR